MYNSSFRVCLFVILLMSPWVVYSAGLGKLTLNSALGQPLKAEIDIVTVNKDEIPSLRANLASREAFTQAGIQYETFFSTLKVSIESRENGNPYIKIASPQAVNEPFLSVLIELNWSSGRLLREYTVLLDPIDSAPPQPVAPVVAETTLEPVESASLIEEKPAKQVEEPKQNTTNPAKTAKTVKGTHVPVNRGDTLTAIASQVLPSGVDLNQMLVALYRANRDAFIADNMNLLKTGAVLQIPEDSEIAAIKKSEARAEVRVQVSDWKNYRNRLTAAASGHESPESIRQADSGKITASVDKKSLLPQGASKEVLRLSSGVSADSQGKSSDESMINRLRMMEEDTIARNLALQEANERVAMLEKTVTNLKQLLELKNVNLSQAQTQAEESLKPPSKLEPQLQPDIKPVEVIPAPESTPTIELESGFAEASTELSPELTPKQPVVAPVANPVLPIEPEEKSLMDEVMENQMYIGAALALILLIALLIVKRRRAQAEKELDIDDDSDIAEDSSDLRSKLASVASSGVAASSFKSDDLASRKINDDEDSDFFPEDNDRQGKTEEEDYPVSDTTDDEDMLDQEPARLNATGEDDEFDLETDESTSEPEIPHMSDTDEEIEATNDLDYKLNVDSDDAQKLEESVSSYDEEAMDDKGIDFEVDVPKIDLSDEADNKNAADKDIPALDMLHVSDIDSAPKVPDLSLDGISLDIEDSSDEKSIPDDTSESWQEAETKLDLAKAYLEMDDKVGAKEMLEEVARDGDAKQKKAAKKLLKGL